MPRFSIRFKLLLLSLVLLSIPYVGFQYLRETERYLQSGLEDSLLAVAGALAVSLEYQSPIFRNSTQDVEGDLALFVHALKFPIQIDGYIEEWVNYLDWSDSFSIIEKRDNESLQNR